MLALKSLPGTCYSRYSDTDGREINRATEQEPTGKEIKEYKKKNEN